MPEEQHTLYLTIESLAQAHVSNVVDYGRSYVFLPRRLVPDPENSDGEDFKEVVKAASLANQVPQLLQLKSFTFAMFLDMVWLCRDISKVVLERLRDLETVNRYAYGNTNVSLRIFLAQNGLPLPKGLPSSGMLNREVLIRRNYLKNAPYAIK
jgi:hypothetical protein